MWGQTSRPWCYIGKYSSPPCKAAVAVRASLRQDEGADEQGNALMYYLAECVDNGRILLTPYPPEVRKKGCMWLKQPIDIYGAFSTAFPFESLRTSLVMLRSWYVTR